jgi:hypothetical protein
LAAGLTVRKGKLSTGRCVGFCQVIVGTSALARLTYGMKKDIDDDLESKYLPLSKIYDFVPSVDVDRLLSHEIAKLLLVIDLAMRTKVSFTISLTRFPMERVGLLSIRPLLANQVTHRHQICPKAAWPRSCFSYQEFRHM